MLEHHFEKLTYFAAVAESGGFAAAARRLHISQSTVSTAVKIIEDELGTELFERSRKGVSLTRSGQMLLATYGALRSRVRDLEAEIRNQSESQERHIVIGTHDTVATGIWPEVMQASVEFPGLHLTLRTNPSASRLMQMLRERAFDCILVAEPEDSEEWEVVEAGRVNYRVFVGAEGVSSLTREELMESGVICHLKALAGRKILTEERLRIAGIPANPRVQVDSLDAVKEMVVEGLGPGILASELHRRYERRGLLRPVTVNGLDQNELGGFDLGLCIPRGRVKDRHYQALVEIVRRILA